MALQAIHVQCTHCQHQFKETPERSFLGFQKLDCPHCHEKVIYPLTSGFRTTYLIIVAVIALSIIGSLSQGQIGFPGLIGLAIIYALIRDWQIRKSINAI